MTSRFESSKIEAALRTAASDLTAAGIADARREASSLLTLATGYDRTFLISHPETELSVVQATAFAELVARRTNREPLQYLRGLQEFYGLEFLVSPNVLIPRPETELIVASAIEFLEARENPVFCEIGVGSGCISVSILAHVTTARATGADISTAALEIAAANAAKHNVTERLKLVESDVFAAIHETEFDLIVSNPPYVTIDDYAQLQPEVRDFEPSFAVTDGADGLTVIRRVIDGAGKRLKQNGRLLIEIGFDQADAVAALCDPKIFDEISFLEDLQGIRRTLSCRRLPPEN